MKIKIKAWLDSGANIHSKRKIEITIDSEDWKDMDDKQKEEFVWEQVSQFLDWGWEAEGE